MKKYNLPVILLKGIILLPQNTLKLEFDSKNTDNNVIDMSLLFHDNYILVVSEYDSRNLPKIGILSKIENNLVLPNGNTRVDIKGLRRVNIVEFLNLNKVKEPLESIVSEIEVEKVDNEEMIINKLVKEIKSYVKNIPYISNSMISLIEKEKSLDKFTDIVVPTLINNRKRMLEYLNITNPNVRGEMLLKDIYQEKEMFQIERKIDMKIRKEMDDSQKEFLIKEKIKLLKEELGETSNKESDVEKLKLRIDKLDCPKKIKERLNFELSRYETGSSMSPEVNVIRDYIEWLLGLPWNVFTKDNDDLRSVRASLDKSHYGLEEVKQRIIEYLAVKKLSKGNNSPIICLVGPPGVGKTSLAFSIAEAMKRNFVKISVSGIKDESEILGHRKTYVGASPGRIIASLKKAKSSNPLFLIDEIDKMSNEYHNDPVSSLLGVLDPEQNKYFSDNYIEEDFDLSHVLFILTANYIENIPEALRDRLEIINISGYTEFEKLDIATKHLLPKIIKEKGLNEDFININNDTILKIIRNYTKESGVRELERQLDKLVRKIVTQIVMNNIKVNKININDKVLEKYLGKEKYKFNTKTKSQVGVVNGLAYTIYGGDTLPIEVNYFKGKGNLILTGSLGEVMKESASIALNYLKSNYQYYKINYDDLINNDIHIHVPEGAIKKDGPSAGIALTLAILSAITKTKIPNTLALTGEITLRGHVLAIGGLKEKSIGALRSGIKTIIIPFDNAKDLEELPDEVKNNIKFIKVKSFKEVYKVIKDVR